MFRTHFLEFAVALYQVGASELVCKKATYFVVPGDSGPPRVHLDHLNELQ